MPAPVPTELKLQRGTFRQAKEDWKARQKAQKAPGTTAPPCTPVPPPPDGLDAAQAGWWRSLGAAVDLLGTYTEADGPAFAMLVYEWTRAMEGLAGNLTELREGQTVPVAHTTITSMVKAANVLAQQFGLNPAARSRLNIAPAPTARPAEDPDDLTPLGGEQ